MRNIRHVSSSSTDSSDFEIVDDDIQMIDPDDNDEECVIIEETRSRANKAVESIVKDDGYITSIVDIKDKQNWEPWINNRNEKSSDKSKNPSVLSEILGVLKYEEKLNASPKPKSRKQKMHQQNSSGRGLKPRFKPRDTHQKKDSISSNKPSDHCLETKNDIAEESMEYDKDIKMVRESEEKIGRLIQKSEKISKTFDKTVCILEENIDTLKDVFDEIDGLLSEKETNPEVIEVLDVKDDVDDDLHAWDPKSSKVYEHLADVYVGKIAEEFLNKTRRTRNRRIQNKS